MFGGRKKEDLKKYARIVSLDVIREILSKQGNKNPTETEIADELIYTAGSLLLHLSAYFPTIKDLGTLRFVEKMIKKLKASSSSLSHSFDAQDIVDAYIQEYIAHCLKSKVPMMPMGDDDGFVLPEEAEVYKNPALFFFKVLFVLSGAPEDTLKKPTVFYGKIFEKLNLLSDTAEFPAILKLTVFAPATATSPPIFRLTFNMDFFQNYFYELLRPSSLVPFPLSSRLPAWLNPDAKSTRGLTVGQPLQKGIVQAEKKFEATKRKELGEEEREEQEEEQEEQQEKQEEEQEEQEEQQEKQEEEQEEQEEQQEEQQEKQQEKQPEQHEEKESEQQNEKPEGRDEQEDPGKQEDSVLYSRVDSKNNTESQTQAVPQAAPREQKSQLMMDRKQFNAILSGYKSHHFFYRLFDIIGSASIRELKKMGGHEVMLVSLDEKTPIDQQLIKLSSQYKNVPFLYQYRSNGQPVIKLFRPGQNDSVEVPAGRLSQLMQRKLNFPVLPHKVNSGELPSEIAAFINQYCDEGAAAISEVAVKDAIGRAESDDFHRVRLFTGTESVVSRRDSAEEPQLEQSNGSQTDAVLLELREKFRRPT